MMITMREKDLSIGFNFAIKELMEILGYKFDNEDRSGKFIVTTHQEVKNAGLRNIRQKDPDLLLQS